jgi:hypothetical protein
VNFQILWWNLQRFAYFERFLKIKRISAHFVRFFRKIRLKEVRFEMLACISISMKLLFFTPSLTVDIKLLQFFILDDCAFGL